ncbi:MAG: hypothetical protein JNM36_00135 [Chitinophagales bacterium]|jgi:hypothetical protein|nr:hypothetical protein [Chitinophagales bacterium]
MVIEHRFIPSDNPGKGVWLKNFAAKVPLYKDKYNITDEELADIIQGSFYFSYVVDRHKQVEEFKINWTTFRDELRDGNQQNGITLPLPTLPDFGTPPPAVPNGILKRAALLAQRIKKHPAYVEADGRDLGIVAEKSAFDPQKNKPAFSIRLIEGGHPEIVWRKGNMDGVEIWVKRNTNNKDFVLLAYDQRPNYTDMHPLPEAGSSEVWQYRLIYRYHDKQAGMWSDVASVTVGN